MSWDDVFDDDYLYFYETFLTDERSDSDTDLIWRLLELEPGMEVLDLACGHGRIANRLAERGARVTGLDAAPMFLELARRDAEARGVAVDYVEGDMRSLPWEARFDRALSWFTAFGYFDDDANRNVLREARRALRPDGRFLVNLNNLAGLLRVLRAATVTQRGDDFLLDEQEFDPNRNVMRSRRTVVRSGNIRRIGYELRMFTFPELRDWMLDVGFSAVAGFGERGGPLTLESFRMNVVARG